MIADKNVRLLSPFDNSIIHRDRIRQLFNFDFRLECYVPKEKRHYGYFCLPILFGARFIGRVDCKAHRKDKIFELIHLHIEDFSMNTEQWLEPFAEEVRRFALFNGCESLTVTQTSPSDLLKKIKKRTVNVNRIWKGLFSGNAFQYNIFNSSFFVAPVFPVFRHLIFKNDQTGINGREIHIKTGKTIS